MGILAGTDGGCGDGDERNMLPPVGIEDGEDWGGRDREWGGTPRPRLARVTSL